MKIQTSHFKGRFLFLLGLTIPAALMSSIYPAQANPSPSTTVNTTAKPFIDSTSRYDSLKGLQAKPRSGINLGKEASEKGKDSSEKGKDQCEKCGDGIMIRPGQEVINPAIFKQKGANIRSQLPTQLLTSQQPII
jgi:hypothetical protein